MRFWVFAPSCVCVCVYFSRRMENERVMVESLSLPPHLEEVRYTSRLILVRYEFTWMDGWMGRRRKREEEEGGNEDLTR